MIKVYFINPFKNKPFSYYKYEHKWGCIINILFLQISITQIKSERLLPIKD